MSQYRPRLADPGRPPCPRAWRPLPGRTDPQGRLGAGVAAAASARRRAGVARACASRLRSAAASMACA